MTADDLEKLREERQEFETRRLSEYACEQRRAMLFVAAVTFAMSWGGVRPSEITAFGIKIARWEESLLIAFLSFVLAYLIGNFSTVAKPEFVTWRAEIDNYDLRLSGRMSTADQLMREGLELLRGVTTDPTVAPPIADHLKEGVQKLDDWLASADLQQYKKRYLEMFRARVRFEFTVPLLIGVAVLYLAMIRIWLIAIP
jgi:hypothetical protein